jgi:hypothetical protein
VKFAEAETAMLTLPEALTLDCTVPSATVAVRWVALLDDEVPKKP